MGSLRGTSTDPKSHPYFKQKKNNKKTYYNDFIGHCGVFCGLKWRIQRANEEANSQSSQLAREEDLQKLVGDGGIMPACSNSMIDSKVNVNLSS